MEIMNQATIKSKIKKKRKKKRDKSWYIVNFHN